MPSTLKDFKLSANIHNGFLLRGSSLEEALRGLKGLREQAQAVARSLLAQEVVKRAVLAKDLLHFGCTEHPLKSYTSLNFLSAAALQIADEQDEVRIKRYRKPDADVSAEVVLIPWGRDVLGIVYTERRVVRDLLKALPGYEAFAYWNNDEKPEGLSVADWEQRAKTWRSALPGWCAPADVGLTYDLISEWHRHTLEQETVSLVMALPLPSRQARVHELLPTLWDEGKLQIPPAKSPGEARRMAQSQELDLEKARVASLLPELTLSHLKQRIEEAGAAQ